MRFYKTEEEIREDLLKALKEKGFNTSDGSVNSLFASVIAWSLGGIYNLLSSIHKECFISTASSESLRLMADEYGISYSNATSDEDLKYLIVSHNLLNGASSKRAIRETIMLNHKEVIEVKFRDFVTGAGSVGIYIFTNSESDSLLEAVSITLLNHIPCGTKIKVNYPKREEILIRVNIKTKTEITISRKLEIKSKVTKALNSLFNNVDADGFTSKDVISTIKRQDDVISKVYLLESSLNGEPITIVGSNIDTIYVVSDDSEIVL